MIELKLHRFDLPLKHTFTIARGSREVQPTLIVELTDGTLRGFGEATTNPYYDVTYESLTDALNSVRDSLRDWAVDDPARLHETLTEAWRRTHLPNVPWTKPPGICGANARELHCIRLWGLDPSANPVSNFTIGIDDVDVMIAKLQEVPDWPIYKIKLGTAHDIDIVRRLRECTTAVFRVDANCGWTAEETIANAVELKDLGVQFIEQPLPADDRAGAARVFAESVLPIIADESCIVESDVDRCAGHFHGINIKLMKCGGLTPARRMIDRARQLELQVMVGCMTESTVGISAIAAAIATVGLCRYGWRRVAGPGRGHGRACGSGCLCLSAGGGDGG